MIERRGYFRWFWVHHLHKMDYSVKPAKQLDEIRYTFELGPFSTKGSAERAGARVLT